MIRLIPVLLLFFSLALDAQTKLDSLIQQSAKLMMTDRKAYYATSDEIISLSRQTKNDSMLIEAFMSRAMVHFLERDYQSAFDYYDTIQNTSQADSREFLEAQIGAADIYPKLNYPDSLIIQKHQSIIKQILPTNDSLLLSSEYSNYGNYLLDKARYYEGIHHLIRAIDYSPKNMLFKRLTNQVKLAKLFLYTQDIEKAEYYSQQAKKIADAKNYQVRGKSIALLMGRIALKKKEFSTADSLLSVALKNFKKNHNNIDVFTTYLYQTELALVQNDVLKTKKNIDSSTVYKHFNKNLHNRGKYFLLNAEFHLKQQQYVKAENDLDSIKLFSEKTQNIFLDADYLLLKSELAEALNRHQESLLYYRQYKEMQDSLFKFQTSGMIYDLEFKYQNQEKQKEIELLTTKNELINVKLKHETWEKTAIGIVAFISLLFLLFLGVTFFKVKSKNQLIRKTVAQKEILLKEIHHRVKNNLQLISSLLNLQDRYIKDEKARQISMEGKTRVRAMSLIHQSLYQKDDLTNLSIDDYFRKLVRELFEIFHTSQKDIIVHFNIETIDLDVDRVIPLGLIFNELMTNILKYAFPEGRQGKVRVNLHQKASGLILEVMDNGIGIQDQQISEPQDSFGFTLIEALLSKWKGKLMIRSENGTQVKIIIPGKE